MNMPKTSLPSITDIKDRFPQFTFVPHDVFHWSPKDNTIYYNQNNLHEPEGIFQLLHEVGHGLAGHTTYDSGIQLIKIESEAWDHAKKIASSYNLKISSKQIEQCLDSYRDWLYLRSCCPNCSTIAIETKANHYRCFNCLQKWKAPANQQTRPYRLKLDSMAT
jgi:hypothetical protein